MSGDWQAGAPGSDGPEEIVGAVRELRPSLQSMLVAAGVAGQAELHVLAEEARERGLRLGELLVARGLVDEEGLGRLVAEQWRLPFLDREQLTVDPVAAGLLPVEPARELGGCVIGFHGGGPLVAVAEPTNERLNQLRARLSATTAGAQASFVVVSGSSLEGLLAHLARFHHSGDAPPAAPEPGLAPVEAEQSTREESVPAVEEQAAVPVEASGAEAADVEAFVADLEQATAGLEVLRERVEQLRAAGHARDEQAAELRRARDAAHQKAVSQQERVRELELALEQERDRERVFRQRLVDVLAEFER